ncbi:MAG: 1,4-dihydroxy-6-naphthoate synthase [Acidobacteriota bacterium]|nr:1,4-dihydroxy-6-naphthoate synthase [Acidobacteriota bacterium]
MTPIHLGISTCPNDTFAFHGILERQVDPRGLDFRIELLDVEELNRRLFVGDFDVAKASFHAALLLSRDLGVLPVGSALGFGVGPLLLAAHADTSPDRPLTNVTEPRPARVLCPGEHTTATLLYKLFHPGQGRLQQAVFSDIMPALVAGDAEFGVCIHEGRFTWQDQGLALVEDLGTVWETHTATPLPLGGILARHRLGHHTIDNVIRVLTDSLAFARHHREETVPTMKRYAQELTDDILLKHVDLYVNTWTTDLGETGRAALDMLSQQAREVRLVRPGARPLTVF